MPVILNGKKNKRYNEEGTGLLERILGGALYIGPPYNGSQYLPNYHVLETAAKYDFPKVKGVTAQREYEDNKSKFCLKMKALEVFGELIRNARYNYIILSYSADGLMGLSDIENIMKT